MSLDFLNKLGFSAIEKNNHYPAVLVGNSNFPGEGSPLNVRSPIDGDTVAKLNNASPAQLAQITAQSLNAFKRLRNHTAPSRGDLVRRIGIITRQYKTELAEVITLEVGKTVQEALGEVQEVIDICEFAVGLSRQLHGLTIVSERPDHRMMEQWHPMGPVAVISAFNFPMAVWAWNAMLALVCGDSVVWKPSEKTPLCAIAMHLVAQQALKEIPEIPADVLAVIVGGADVGEAMTTDSRFPLVSATGSVPMGRKVAQKVAARLGRSLLELGGNNAMIVTPSADTEQAVRAIVFSAVGTTGQRCTTLRRLILHSSLNDQLIPRLVKAYSSLPIGDPRDEANLIGPLVDEHAYEQMQESIKQAKEQGGELLCGGERITDNMPQGVYIKPAIIKIHHDAPIVHHETFAPILYILNYDELAEAIEIQNEVPQGLSSAIFTDNIREAERFLSPAGSDCGIANVNIGTSGAEIGGAFGGEKDTGGGRESGSDSWKNYMRRTTNTINYGEELPLAQGIKFDL